MKILILLQLCFSIGILLLSGCTQSKSRLGYLGYTQILGPDGTVITIDPHTGKPIEDPALNARKAKEAARRLAREQKEATREARRQSRLPQPEIPREPEYWWRGDEVTGRPSITIHLGEQRAYFSKGGTIVGMAPISSGREGYRTPTGNYSIIQKSQNHVSNLYGDYVDSHGNVVVANVGIRRDPRPSGTKFRGAPMPYFLRIVGGVGMHAGYLPGYPASHGCIRLPEEMARIYFENVSHGTPVAVRH